MALIVIPDFTATAKPAVADVRAAELAIVQAVGGVHEAVRYPGGLDAANIDAATLFLLAQQAEPRARVVFAQGRDEPLGDVAFAYPPPSVAGPRCVVAVNIPADLDTVTFWHSDPAALTGIVPVYRNGVLLVSLAFPALGVAQGEFAEFPFPYSVLEGDVFDFRWLDGVAALKTVAGVAPSP